MTTGCNNFNCFAENQVTKFSARDAKDFNEAAGEREIAPKCGSLPRDARDLVGLSIVGGKLLAGLLGSLLVNMAKQRTASVKVSRGAGSTISI